MATIPLNIPDDLLNPLITALCSAGGYQEEIVDPESVDMTLIPNPVSKAKFARKMIYKYLRDTLLREFDLSQRKDVAAVINAYRSTLTTLDEA